MRKLIELFKRTEPEPLDPDVNLALRETADWPIEQHHRGGYRQRSRTTTVQRDAQGRVVNFIETTNEDEFEDYSDHWGK